MQGSLMLINDYKLFRRHLSTGLYYSHYQQLTMSYFQKYQRAAGNSRITTLSTSNTYHEASSGLDPKRNSDSRESYLKAFKKYYIDQLLTQKAGKSVQEHPKLNKENFCFHEPPLRENKAIHNIPQVHSKSCKETQYMKQSAFVEDQGDLGRMNRSKIVAMVNNKENQIEELLYSSISQIEREMVGMGQGNDLARQNKMLRGSIERLKLILKQKLEVALKRNKEELTLMFDQYSSMIKKLLQDKEQLTGRLEESRSRLALEEQEKRGMQEECQNRIRIIVEENNAQVSSTKQQIQEFLDMIIQFEEESNAEKEELQRLREKVIELEMENDRLKKCQSSEGGTPQSSLSSMFERSSPQTEIDRYAEKIENLLTMVDRLQQENYELSQFLKLCKCSKIKKNDVRESQAEVQEETIRDYQRKMLESEKQFIREEMLLREAMRKKDQCIDRLNLVIEEMRKGRYESVDQMTEEALSRQTPR